MTHPIVALAMAARHAKEITADRGSITIEVEKDGLTVRGSLEHRKAQEWVSWQSFDQTDGHLMAAIEFVAHKLGLDVR